MKKPSMMIIAALTVAASVLADVTFDKDTTLAADADYSGQTVAVYGNAMLDLAGHKLKASAIAGAGAISSGGAYITVGMVTTPADLTGCIQLDYTPLYTDRIEAKVCFNASINKYAWVFSARKDSDVQQFDFFATSSKWGVFYSNNSKSVDFSGWSMNTDYEIVLDGNLGKAFVNGTEQTFTSEKFTAGMPLVLFANTTSGGWPAKSLTMYYLRAYGADGALKVNLVPMKRVADGTIGLYDTVKSKFWTLTKGSFTAAEKLESVTTASDNTGHIDTGYVPSCTDRVETKVNFGGYPASGIYYWLFSARTSYQHNDRFECELSANKYLYVDRGASSGGQVGIVPAEKDLELVFDAAVPSFSIDGEKKTISKGYGSEAFTMTKTLHVFDCVQGGWPCKSTTMYYFRVYDSTGALKVDLVPARREADGAVGFCDFVRGGFYKLSAGTLDGGGAVATQTALTAPGGTCSCAASNNRTITDGTAGSLFNDNFRYYTDADHRAYFNTTLALPVTIDYDFGEGEGKVVNAYSIWCGDKSRTPKAWKLEGSNDKSSWQELDSQTGQTAWAANAECRTKVFANMNAYRYVRLTVTEGNGTSFDLTQLEYYNIPATARPGELHLASDAATANATVRLGGDLKLVKEGTGTFTASKAAQGYTGGTEIAAGAIVAEATDALGVGGVRVASGATLRLASPQTVAGAFEMASGANLAFEFASRTAAPILTLAGGASVPPALNVGIVRGADFALPPAGVQLTDGFDLGAVTPVFAPTDWMRKMAFDKKGNLWAYGPVGFMVILQ